MVQKKSPLGELRDLAESIELSPRRTRETVYGGFLIAAVVATLLLGDWLGWLERPELFHYGVWHHLAGERDQVRHVTIVAVDDASLDEYPDDPLVCWTPMFARAFTRLRDLGARVIGVDYHYLVGIESWLKNLEGPEGDASRTFNIPFRRELAAGDVVLAATLGADDLGRRAVSLPLVDYYFSLPRPRYDVALINFFTDPDGVIRRFIPALAQDPPLDAGAMHLPEAGVTTLTFGPRLAAGFRKQDPARVVAAYERERDFAAWNAPDDAPVKLEAFPRIGFTGPPGTYPRVSFRRLLDDKKLVLPGRHPELVAELLTPDADSLVFQIWGRIIIVAYEPRFMQDQHPTPFAQGFLTIQGVDMSGAEIHANIIDTLLSGRAPRPVPGSLTFPYLALAVVAATALFFRLSIWQGLPVALALSVTAAGASYLAFRADWLLPAANLQAGFILTYVGVLMIRLTGEERERKHIHHVFGRYVSDKVVERLLASGRRPDLGGEALHVSVLFADIRNFTAMSERLTPRQVVEMLNAYFTRVCEPILEQGGTVDKYIGDAVMAVFGAPVPYPDHARRAVRAAVALARMAVEFRPWMEEHFAGLDLPQFRIGVGLHTGEAVVGNIGSPRRMEFTSIGDTVNITSRLESHSKELGWTIVASRDIIAAAGAGVVTGQAATIKVKGKTAALEVMEVLDLKEA